MGFEFMKQDEFETDAVKALRAELAVLKDTMSETAKNFRALGDRLKGIKEATKSVREPMEKLAKSFKMMKVPQGMQALFTGMPKLSKAMGTFLTPLAKKMGGNKFKKGVKAMGGLMGSIMKSSASAWAMAKLMQLMEPFLSLLELFNPIFEVLAAIFQEALMPVIIELIPYIMQATMWLMENKAAIIQVINVLVPLLLIFHLLQGNFEDLQVIMIPLSAIIKQVQNDWNNLIIVLNIVGSYLMETLGPMWMWFIDNIMKPQYDFIVNVLGPAWTWLLENALRPIYDYIVGDLYTSFDDFIGWLEDLEDIADDASDAIESLVGWMEDIEAPSWLGGGGKSGGGDDDDDDDWDWRDVVDPYGILHADGGLTQGPSRGTIGEAGTEALIPLETSNPFTDAIEEMAYAQQRTLIVLEEIRDGQQKVKGLNRRRFG